MNKFQIIKICLFSLFLGCFLHAMTVEEDDVPFYGQLPAGLDIAMYRESKCQTVLRRLRYLFSCGCCGQESIEDNPVVKPYDKENCQLDKAEQEVMKVLKIECPQSPNIRIDLSKVEIPMRLNLKRFEILTESSQEKLSPDCFAYQRFVYVDTAKK